MVGGILVVPYLSKSALFRQQGLRLTAHLKGSRRATGVLEHQGQYANSKTRL